MNNDLINREWLKDAFDNLCCHNCKICRNFRNEDSFYKCNLIENAPTVPQVTVFSENASEEEIKVFKQELENMLERTQGEWIPVSERLPEQNGFYITTCRDICENRVHAVMFDGVRKKWGRGGVIAWQSLPEPYKEGGAE